ncbi:pyruvate kinase [Anaerotignum sp.]|uniref:pyruvate kinase n=1 Tax=Anaerotignum sp. TaxID=2039241 RepID=UPI0028B1125D|nr:pyruvate kinase [Anaerotignum sp.]
MRRTKIVCTLGPATDSVETMKKLIQNGLDAARVNFSHGTYESHGEMIKKLKQAREELGAPIPLILDTKGPEIRIKTFAEGKIVLEAGDKFTLTTEDIEGTKEMVSVTYSDLPNDLQVGSRVLIDDGLIELRVENIVGPEVRCVVVNGGKVGSRKGVNLPGVKVNLPALTEKDIEDLKFGIANEFDIVAASFIRSASDVARIRKVLEENGGEGIQIISKIENQEGVDRIDEILEVSDGIMVARGDLGVEIPPEEVPLVQKQLIAKANQRSKPVITATQMLESMVNSPRPTRAEANDVANAIFDGTDAIMLSGETAAGNYPVEAVATMARIAEKTESSINYSKMLTRQFDGVRTNITNAISFAACTTAAELNTACICTITQSGFTARMISKHRPVCPIVAATMTGRVWRQLNLVWGCKPMLHTAKLQQGKVFDTGMEVAQASGIVKNGDTVVLALGMPVGVSGATNTLRVDIVGDVLCKGIGVGSKKVSGRARVIKMREDMERNFQKGDILVATATDNDFMPYIQKASAIIVGPMDHSDDCHAEIAGRALDIPVIICNAKVVDFIPNDALISVDASTGFICAGLPDDKQKA